MGFRSSCKDVGIMNWELTRNRKDLYGIFGKFVSQDSKTGLVSLEHAFLQPDGSYAPIIPPGMYLCERRLSPKFGYDLFWLQGVPGHTFVEIHKGNYNKDSEGCILLGTQIQSGALLESKIAFDKFMELMTGVNSFTLKVNG